MPTFKIGCPQSSNTTPTNPAPQAVDIKPKALTADGMTITLTSGVEGSTAQDYTLSATVQGTQSAGFDVNSLPVMSYTDNSTIIAVAPDGTLYRAASQKLIVKDVAVSGQVTQSVLVDDKTYHTITGSVSNISGDTVEEVVLTIHKENEAEVSNVITDGAFDAGSLTIRFTNLTGGSRADFTFTLANVHNTFVNISVATDVDINLSNNVLALPLPRATTTSNVNNVYTQECPELIMTVADTGEQVLPSRQVSTLEELQPYQTMRDADDKPARTFYLHFVDTPSLQGFAVNVNASSVRVYKMRDVEVNDMGNGMGFASGVALIQELEPNHYKSWNAPLMNFDSWTEADASAYTFSNGRLTFTEAMRGAIVLCRPAGETCKWQTFVFGTFFSESHLTVNEQRFTVSGLDQQYIKFQNYGSFAYGGDNYKDLPLQETADWFSTNKPEVPRYVQRGVGQVGYGDVKYYTRDMSATTQTRVVITLPANTPFDFTITDMGYFQMPNQQGAVAIDANTGRVVVAATATATDSVRSEAVDIIIV